MIKIKSISKRTIALILSLLMLLSSGIVTTLAANIEMAETGAKTYVAGEYLYFKNSYVYGWNDTLWVVSGMYLWAHLWNDTSVTDIRMDLYTGEANKVDAIYRCKIPSDVTYNNVIFSRSTSSSSNNWSWGQSNEISLDSSYNTYYEAYGSGNNGEAKKTRTASAPASCVTTVTNALSGSGTSNDPYLVAVGSSYTVQVKATKDDAGNEGFGYNINSNSSKVANNTTGTYTKSYTASSTANTTSAYTGYAWCYENSTSYYSTNYKASSTIYVKTVATNHNVTFINNGSQYGEIQEVKDGAYVTVPSNPTRDGYTFKGWSKTENGTVVNLTTTPITADTTFYAVYESITYPITVNVNNSAYGSAEADPENATHNGTVELEAKANHGYEFSHWEDKDGVNVSSDNPYTISNITSAQEYTAVFITAQEYTVTASAGENGTVSPTSTTAYSGDKVTFTAKPADGYAVDKWTVDGVEKKTGGNTYELTVDGNNKVHVTFKEDKSHRNIYLYTNWDDNSFSAYAWTDGVGDNGAFPGQVMDKVGTDEDGNSIYYISLDSKYLNVVFAKTYDSGSKSKDVKIPEDQYTFYYKMVGNEQGSFYPNTDSLEIYLDNGANKYVKEGSNQPQTTIGKISVDTNEDGVFFMSEERYGNKNNDGYTDTGYYTANVAENTPVTVTVQVDQTNCPEYKVEGFLIDGKKFITANNMGSGKYQFTYSFEKDGTVVLPIYFYTDTFIEDKKLEVITLYAERPADVATGWGDYMAAYVWYENSDKTNTDYMFGSWPGQCMIPVEGLDNYWETKVVKESANGYPAAGITFSNYGGWKDDVGVMYPVTNTTNIQVYDYYEFITLAAQGSKNITFVMKEMKQKDNNGHTAGKIDAPNPEYFVDYADYEGVPVDILNCKISEEAASKSASLYIIHNAPVNDTSGNPLNGYFYVDCYVYQSDGSYVGTFKSYKLLELSDENTSIVTTDNKTVDFKDYAGYRVMIDYEGVTEYGRSGSSDNTDKAKRYDGQWYKESLKATISVNVAETDNDGVDFEISDTPNDDTYGLATAKGDVSFEADRSDKVSLNATAKPGYKFIGWYDEDGDLKSTSTSYTVTAVISTTYTAVFQALKGGEFIVTHEIYNGEGTAAYRPLAHGGRADLYIGIENITKSTKVDTTKTQQATINATVGDELLITIGTDPLGVDQFFAWYIDAVDKNGKTTFEEVGVDNYYDGIHGNLHDNNVLNSEGIDTVVGSSEYVEFQFKYKVKENIFNIALYSDMRPVSADVTLIYNYENRYGENRSVTKKYTLTDYEIAGYEGNGNVPFRPSDAIIQQYAPYVEYLYKDTTWVITDFDNLECSIWATQPKTVYTVTINVGGTIDYVYGEFNTDVQLKARDFDPNATNMGFWYNDDGDGMYEKGVDTILSYGTYYGLRITDNITLGYENVDSLDFAINIDEPVYGREQTTDSEGNNATDTIYIDYMTSILVPYFKGNTVNGNKITEVIYNGNPITTTNTSVTLETLEKYGFEFDYGLILEQLHPNLVDSAWGKTELDEATLKSVASGQSSGATSDGKRYLAKSSAVGLFELTNKNRLLYTFQMANTDNNQKKYYNVYGYLKVTNTVTNETKYYFSDMQTLNIKKTADKVGTDQLGNSSQ